MMYPLCIGYSGSRDYTLEYGYSKWNSPSNLCGGANAVELSIEHLLGFFKGPFVETPLSDSWLRGSGNFRTIVFDAVDFLQDVLKDCDGSFWVIRGKHGRF
jgi:hypothetical protein